MKILVTGDLHIDALKIGKVNPKSDLDLRVEDFIRAVEYTIQYAINNKIDLFILNGDLFKGRTSSHHIEAVVAECLKKITSNMQLIINLGNHDYTPKQLSYGIHTYSIFEKLNLPNTKIITEISHLQYNDCDVVIYPYYDLKRKTNFTTNEQLIEWIYSNINSLNLTRPCKLFVGHGTPEGTAITEDWYFDLDLIDEPVLPKKLFEPFDKVLFSHIHRCHAIGEKIFHIGSPERVDFSEADQDKGFVVYDTDTKEMNWISTNPRSMINLDLDLNSISDFDDPNVEIMKCLDKVENFSETMIKLTIQCSEQTLSLIDHNALKQKLLSSFYFKPVTFTTPKIQKTRLKEITEQLNPYEALEKALNSRSDLSESDLRQILVKGRAILAIEET